MLTHASRIPLQLTLADGSAYPHPGRIIFADRQVNTQTGTIQIVGGTANSKNLLRPGQYARIQTPTGNLTGALLVPQAAVNQQQGTYQVTVVGADKRAQLRTVEVGPRVGALWVIIDGPEAGRTRRGGWRREGKSGRTRESNAVQGDGGALIMANFFIRRPIVAIVIAILTVIVGVITIVTLPVAQFPQIAPPEIRLQANYPGADAQTLEQAVATPIEQQVSGVDNMAYMYSLNATANQQTQLLVDFDLKTDPNMDLILTQSRSNWQTASCPLR